MEQILPKEAPKEVKDPGGDKEQPILDLPVGKNVHPTFIKKVFNHLHGGPEQAVKSQSHKILKTALDMVLGS